MSSGTNYSKVITNISQMIYDNFRQLITDNLSLIKRNQVVIFGAGVRGTLLSILLQEFGIDNIIFCDNNKQLLGGRINNHPIVALSDIIKQEKDVVVLVSPENNKAIIQQLKDRGFIENLNIINCGTEMYNWFIEQFMDNEDKDILLVGDCGFMYFSIFDTIRDSLGTIIIKQLSQYRVKQLTVNSMGMRAFYNILLTHFKLFRKPKYIFLSIDLSIFNGKHHYLPNSQHVELIEKIYQVTNKQNNKLYNYLQVIRERYNNSNMAMAKSKGYEDNSQGILMNKAYIKMNYMYKLNAENEELMYLIKILDILKEQYIIPILFILPINYCQAQVYYGDEFLKKYQHNNIIVKNKIYEKGYDLLDLSLLLNKNYFLDNNTMDEAICYEGRVKVCTEIMAYFKEVLGR